MLQDLIVDTVSERIAKHGHMLVLTRVVLPRTSSADATHAAQNLAHAMLESISGLLLSPLTEEHSERTAPYGGDFWQQHAATTAG
jgi:hypothetical protein